MQQLLLWQMGSFSGRSWQEAGILLAVLLPGVLYLCLFSRQMDMMTFGEEAARTMGVDTKRVKLKLIVAASLLTGTAVCFTGDHRLHRSDRASCGETGVRPGAPVCASGFRSVRRSLYGAFGSGGKNGDVPHGASRGSGDRADRRAPFLPGCILRGEAMKSEERKGRRFGA